MNEDMLEIIAEMADIVVGNHMGAYGAVEALIKKGAVDVITAFASNDIVGRKAYWLWNCVCNNDVFNMKKIASAIDSGKITTEMLNANIPEEINMARADENEITFFKNLAGIAIQSQDLIEEAINTPGEFFSWSRSREEEALIAEGWAPGCTEPKTEKLVEFVEQVKIGNNEGLSQGEIEFFSKLAGIEPQSQEFQAEDSVMRKFLSSQDLGLTHSHVSKKPRRTLQKIDIGSGSSIEDAVNLLLRHKEYGNTVYLNFNGTKLYSSTVSMDKAYLKITGKTKADFDKDKAEWLENSKTQLEEGKQRAIADIPNVIERGKPFIYRQKYNSWEKLVEVDANGMYHGFLANEVIRLMEALENRVSIDEAVKMMDDQGHSGFSASLVNCIMLEFAKQGPEFYETIVSSYRELEPEEIEKIRMVRQENKGLISKQHTKTQLQKLLKTLRNRNLWVTENVSHWDLKTFRQLREDLKDCDNGEILEMYSPRLEFKMMRNRR